MEKVFAQIGDERVQLTGDALEAFLIDKQESIKYAESLQSARLEREAKLESALNKLKSLGLTESEAKIIIGLE